MSALVLDLLREDWGEQQALVDCLLSSPYSAFLEEALNQLRREALFESRIHGPGHIERTLCHGAFCALAEGLDETDTRLLLLACAYHDVGRVDDKVDEEHGHRSAARIPELTGLTGEACSIVQAAVDAHARNDAVLIATLEGYALRDFERGRRIAELLKDADGLDRVRIWDLNPAYLRRAASRERAAFAKELFRRWQERTGGEFVMDFVRKWKKLDEFGNPVSQSGV
jgi:HD superfamily phosphodiesterase